MNGGWGEAKHFLDGDGVECDADGGQHSKHKALLSTGKVIPALHGSGGEGEEATD